MGDKVPLNLRIDEELKKEMEEHVEESTEYTTVTGLVRGAVNAKLNGSTNPLEQTSPAISSDVGDIKDELERVRKDVRWLRNHQEDASDISELANRVRDELVVLPSSSGHVQVPEDVDMDEKTYRRKRAAESIIAPEDAEDETDKQTLEAIADRVGTTSEEVKEAIERLRDEFLPIVEIELPKTEHLDYGAHGDDHHPLDSVENVGTEIHYFLEE